MRACPLFLAIVLSLACGGGGGGGRASTAGQHPIAAPADNVVPVHVDFGLDDFVYINGLFATVTLCVPGTDQCQDIEHVLVDTGSSGLRVMGSALKVKLPTLSNDQGVALAACGQFVGGFTWGPMATADFRMGTKSVSNLAVHIIDKATFPVPSDCTGFDAGDLESMRANGILGIGMQRQDCGVACTPEPPLGYRNPKIYYACASAQEGGCTATTMPLDKQLTNPVPLFAQDNNGTIIQLPPIPEEGAERVEGALVFGIDTRDNNGLGDAHVIRLDKIGLFQSRYKSEEWTDAFIDSGSNGTYFLDSETAKIPTCDEPIEAFYCPSSTKTVTAEAQSYYGLDEISIRFSVANVLTLVRMGGDNVAFNNLTGPSSAPQSGSDTSGFFSYFDYGLPFFYGRNVYTSIEDQPTPVGASPFVAF